jgi:hypothetical protein
MLNIFRRKSNIRPEVQTILDLEGTDAYPQTFMDKITPRISEEIFNRIPAHIKPGSPVWIQLLLYYHWESGYNAGIAERP